MILKFLKDCSNRLEIFHRQRNRQAADDCRNKQKNLLPEKRS